MPNPTESAEPVNLRSSLQAELAKLEAGSRNLHILVIVMACVLGFGVLALFIPPAAWFPEPIHVSIRLPLVFVFLMTGIVLCIYLVRHESELRRLRLLTLQQALSAQSEYLAGMFDPVTNVFARRFLHELLQREVSSAERNQRPLALMMCDVDNFKHVNDRYGHLMGDDILAQIAAILKACVRGSDHVVRYGGDEFLLILPETDESGAQIVRSRILDRVTEWGRTTRLEGSAVSLSVGMYLHVPGQSAERDLAEADLKMYAEKRSIESVSAEVPR